MAIDMPLPEQEKARQPQESTARYVVSVATRHWLLILMCTILSTITFVVVGQKFRPTRDPQFRGSTTLRIVRSAYEAARPRSSAQRYSFTPNTLVAQITPELIARDVTRALIQEEVAEGGTYAAVATDDELKRKEQAVTKALNFTPRENDMVIEVTASDGSNERARRLTDMAARAFIRQSRELASEGTQGTLRILEKSIQSQHEKMSELQLANMELMQGDRITNVTEELEKLKNQLDKGRREKEALEAKQASRLEQLREQLADLPNKLGPSASELMKNLVDQLYEKENEDLELSLSFTPEYTKRQQLQEEITVLRQELAQLISQETASDQAGLTAFDDLQELKSRYRDGQEELIALETDITLNRESLRKLEADLPELANLELRDKQIARELDRRGDELVRLDSERQELLHSLETGLSQIERQSGTNVQDIRKAQGQNRRRRDGTLGILVGLLVGFGLAMLLETMDTSIRSIDDVNIYIKTEVLGTIPEMKFGRGRSHKRRGAYVTPVDEEQIDACIVTQHDPKSPVSEAYRALRTNFQFATLDLKPKTLMVTSAVPGEGKTTTAVNFAVTMADRGMRVLIMDTDLRRPNVHRVLKMERGLGVSDLLREGLDVDSVIRATRVENLFIISSGRVPPNPSELIGSERMANLIEELSEKFDLVICDAPSILVVTDPVLLSTHVDTSIMVIAVDNARRETIIRAKKLLDTAQAHCAGIVLNGLQASRRHYYYYYYYYDDAAAAGRARRRWYLP